MAKYLGTIRALVFRLEVGAFQAPTVSGFPSGSDAKKKHREQWVPAKVKQSSYHDRCWEFHSRRGSFSVSLAATIL